MSVPTPEGSTASQLLFQKMKQPSAMWNASVSVFYRNLDLGEEFAAWLSPSCICVSNETL